MRTRQRVLLGSIVGLAGVSMIGTLSVTAATVTNASTSTAVPTTRTATVPIKAQPYYTGTTGQLVTLAGTEQQVTITPSQALKAYAKTTWIVTGQTDITMPTGTTTRYYQVKNAKDGVEGWLDQAAAKPGHNYQTGAPVTKKAKNYVTAKTGKVYQLSGTRAAMQLSNGRSLSKKQTYRATKQRYYYRHGTKYLYFYVKSTNGTKGWVWHKYLKGGTYVAVAKKQQAIKKRLRSYLTGVTKDSTCMVSFYNLAPKAGSKAAKANNAAVYADGKLAVHARGNQVTTSASTYKLYIAAYLMHLKQQKRFSWTAANRAGMQRMIVNSANDYPESILHRYGATNINRWLASQGYYGGVFRANRNASTTANSLKQVLLDLQNGKKAFTNKRDRAYILSLMGRQLYRRGIPTGTAQALAGTTVQDKVGFLYDHNSDAAIVTMPNGHRYVLVVMTKGHGQSGFSGFPRIAKIAKQVQKIVY
ncbi:serine hydrolase [Lactiplantibacillus daowaiensis]|uniref:Serine hydrolase n=1 Tax=Lactiplantibacillus daowaiensis TaxID=2559918 RepID=A0ABW1S072_9LACO|nr:serine hydrolase [Lactiplantibacillus daowaiensis]